MIFNWTPGAAAQTITSEFVSTDQTVPASAPAAPLQRMLNNYLIVKVGDGMGTPGGPVR